MKVSGESGEVSGVTVDDWLERIPEIVSEYAIEDIWNLDETGVFESPPKARIWSERERVHRW